MTSTLRPGAKRGRAIGLAVVILGMVGCSLDDLLKSNELPPDLTDPAITQTPEGALAAYRGTVVLFRRAFGNASESFIPAAGELSDELRQGASAGDADRRVLPESDFARSAIFGLLQKVRGQAGQAIGLLNRYAPEPALVSHMYALQGYAELLLAELYCSGIPLSTVDFEGDYTFKPGSTTAQVFTHAAALLDTALALAGDSVRFQHLAAVGKARALLGLGEYAAAGAAVMAVPDMYSYLVSYSAATGADARNFAFQDGGGLWSYSVADHDGGNGLNYITAADPRVQVTLQVTTQTTPSGLPVYRPQKYATSGTTPIVLASGVEARLIEGEAALRANPDDGVWLATLNALRTDGTFETTATSPPDTLWHAGSGGVAGLAPLADPGIDTARVSLLFRERAFWLFLTGHRQGDLRRLIRQYGRSQVQVYPIGQYPGPTPSSYGSDVTVPIPLDESVSNPLFTGCATRDA